MTPPTARTWSRCGTTPIVTVRGRSQRRISIAALACYKPGQRSRLIYRQTARPDHKTSRRRSFAWADYRGLLIAAHQQLGKPIVLVWDDLNVHKDARLRVFIDAQDRITVHYLPPYAPQRNPVEGIWSLLRRRCQANAAFTDPVHLMCALRRGLRLVQYRPDLINGCLVGTGPTA
nr:transposase [Streptomyces sp. GS7]